MIRTLQQHGIHCGMQVYMECTITRLLTDGDRIRGAFGYWRDNGRFVVFHAKSVVLATGGIGRAFRINSNSWECTGDGQALAYLAGAELMDMEFMQFHPPALASQRARDADHRGRARGGRHAAQQRPEAHHVRLHPRALCQRDGQHRGGGRSVASREHDRRLVEGASNARPASARHRGARHPQRGQGGSRKSPRGRLSRHPLAP